MAKKKWSLELCLFCKDYDGCQLAKKKENRHKGPCDYGQKKSFFALDDAKISAERYQGLLDLLEKVASPPSSQIALPIEIPSVFTEKNLDEDWDRNFYMHFINTDFDKTENLNMVFGFDEMRLLPWAYFCPYNVLKEGTEGNEDAVLETVTDMKAVQWDLRQMVDRWSDSGKEFGKRDILPDWGEWGERSDVVARLYLNRFGAPSEIASLRKKYVSEPRIGSGPITDSDRINIWLSSFSVGIQGIQNGLYFNAYGFHRDYYPYNILYFLFALDVIEKQDIRQCVVCGSRFKPSRRKDGEIRKKAARTCSRPCAKIFSKNKNRQKKKRATKLRHFSGK